ncbi:MAG: iron ABC transporter permease [Betaproteobacteria bacterium]|nr:iron ABC transporter permease [Betaproteobacteria bacterium]
MRRWLNPVLALLMLVTATASLALGSVQVDVLAGLRDWLSQNPSGAALVVGEIRLPRTLLAMLVGAALGLSGAALQGLLRNPLADAGLTGASPGAALGAAAVFYFGLFPSAGLLAPALAGLVGAALAMVLMLSIAASTQASMIVLAGLAISTLAGALLATVLNFAPNPFAMQELVFWLLGSVSDRSMNHVLLLLPALILGFGLLWQERPFLAAITLGEAVAESLGFHFAKHSKRVILAAATIRFGPSPCVFASPDPIGEAWRLCALALPLGEAASLSRACTLDATSATSSMVLGRAVTITRRPSDSSRLRSMKALNSPTITTSGWPESTCSSEPSCS